MDATACEQLPEAARRRTYTTTLASGRGVASLGGAQFIQSGTPYATWNVLYTALDAGTADLWFQDPPIWEALAARSYLVIFGDAHGTLDADGNGTVPFWARVEYCAQRAYDQYPECAVPVVACESQQHQLSVRTQ